MKKDLKNIRHSKYRFGSMGWNLAVNNSRVGSLIFKSGMFAFSLMWILGSAIFLIAFFGSTITGFLVIMLKGLDFTSQNPPTHFFEITEHFDWSAMSPCINILWGCLSYFMLATGVSDLLHNIHKNAH